MSSPAVVDQVLDRFAFGEEITLSQFPDSGGGSSRRVLWIGSVAALLGLALLPKGDRLLHNFGRVAARARCNCGKLGFQFGRETNFHDQKDSNPAPRVKEIRYREPR